METMYIYIIYIYIYVYLEDQWKPYLKEIYTTRIFRHFLVLAEGQMRRRVMQVSKAL